MICPVCKREIKRIYGHLNSLINDEKHKHFLDNQINIVVKLFTNNDFSKHSNPKDFGSILTYDNCLNIWREHFSEFERKERSKKLNALGVSKALKGKPFSKEHKQALAANRNPIPWNKGLTIEDERVKNNIEKRSVSMSIVLKEKYKNGEMVAWKKGLTKENSTKVFESANKVSKTMSGITPSSYGISGIRGDIGHHAVSTYEANIYRIFQYHSAKYLYEFDNIKEIVYPDGEIRNYRIDMKDIEGVFGIPGAYLEIKGFFKQKDRIKVKLFKEQYPNETLLMVGYGDKREKHFWKPDIDYAELEKKYKTLIPLWEDKKQNLKTHPHLFEN
ncbi:hypothetical protein D3C71_1341200 [compost metagenome]